MLRDNEAVAVLRRIPGGAGGGLWKFGARCTRGKEVAQKGFNSTGEDQLTRAATDKPGSRLPEERNAAT